jgi:hypothetical protein
MLSDVAALIRAMHAPAPAQRPTAQSVAARFAALERRCQGQPPARVPSKGALMAGYWHQGGADADHGHGHLRSESLESFRTNSEDEEDERLSILSSAPALGSALTGGDVQAFDSLWRDSDEARLSEEGAEWTRTIARADSYNE